MQAVIVRLVLVKNSASKLYKLLLFDLLILVITEKESDGIYLASHDRTRHNGASLERLDER